MSFYGQGSLSGVGAFRPPQTSNRPMLAPLTHSTHQPLLSTSNNPLSWVVAPSSSPTHTQASSSPRVSPLHHQHHQQQQQQQHHAIRDHTRDHRENRELDRELDRELRFRANIIADQQRRIQGLEEQLKNAMEKMDQMANQLMDYENERRMFSRSMNLYNNNNNPSILPLPNNMQQEPHNNNISINISNNHNNNNNNNNNTLSLWKEGISPVRSMPTVENQNTPKKPAQQSRYWTQEEHKKFLDALERYGAKDVKAIAQFVGTRNATQVRTHAQKYFLKLQREKSSKNNKSQGLSPPSHLGSFQVPNSQDGSDAKGVSPVALSSALSLLHDMDDDDESRSSEDEDDVQHESGFSSSSPTSHSSVSTSSSPQSNVRNTMPLGLSLTSFSLLLSAGSPDQYNNNNNSNNNNDNDNNHHGIPFKKRKTSLPVSISSSPPSERAAPSANSSSSNSPVSKSSLLQISALVSPYDD